MKYKSLRQLLHKGTGKSHLFILFFIAIIAVTGLVGAESFNVSTTNASNIDMLISGNAWSPNVGWISFSGTVTNSSHTLYGVYENPTTGALSGNAWSYSQMDQSNPAQPSGLGWLQFGVSDATHPAAKVDFSNGGNITGYARFISAENGSWGSPTMGWVSFSGTAKDNSSYKVVQNANCTWSGYAWEPTNAGWIGMSGITQSNKNYGVYGTNSSVCSQINPSKQQLTCTASQSTTQVTFTTSPGTLSSYTWKLNGVTKVGNASSLTVNTVHGNSYAAQVSASVNGKPQTVNCPLVTIPPTLSGMGTGIITGTLTAYPSRVEGGKSTPIEFTWTSNNVKNTDTCSINRRSANIKMPSKGSRISGGHSVVGMNKSSFPKTRGGSISNIDHPHINITSQTNYYVKCNGKVASNPVLINVVPTFSNF